MALRRKQAADALGTLAGEERSVMRDAVAGALLDHAVAPEPVEPFPPRPTSHVVDPDRGVDPGRANMRWAPDSGPKPVILSDEDFEVWQRAGRWRELRHPGDPWTRRQVAEVVASFKAYENAGRSGAISGCKQAIAGYRAQLPEARARLDEAWAAVEALPDPDRDDANPDGRRLVRLRWVQACSALENVLAAIADNRRQIELNKGGGPDAA